MGFTWTAAVLVLAAGWQAVSLTRTGAWRALTPAGGWPPGPWLIANLGRSAGAMALAAFLILLSTAIGALLLGWAGRRKPGGPERWASPLLGYLVISSALLGTACLGLWQPAVLVAAAVAAVIAAFNPATGATRDWVRGLLSGWRAASWAGRSAALFLILWLLVLLCPPELAMDCLTYDLTFPQQVLRAHRLLGSDLYSHWAIPLPAEFPFAYPVMLGVDPAARIVTFLLACAGGMVLWTALNAAPVTGWTAGAAAVVLALVVPSARSGLMVAKSDAFAVGYALAAAGLLLHAGAFSRGGRRGGALAAGALLLGATVAVKYLVLPLAVALAAAVVLRTPHRDRSRSAGVCGAAFVLPVLPWSLKAWCLEADPLPPVGASVLPGLFGVSGTKEQVRAMFLIYLQDVRKSWAFPLEAVRIAIPNSLLLVAAIPWLGRLPSGAGVLLLATAVGYLGLVGGIRGAIEHVERFCHPAYSICGLIALATMAAAAREAAEGVSAGRRRAVASARWAALALGVLCAIGLGRFEWWPGGNLRVLHNRYLAGRLDARGMRLAGTLAYGAILPSVRAAVGEERPPRDVLAIGEIQYWDIPARVRTQVLGPPFVWRAAAGAGSARRISIRFRQANVGWIIYNAPLAGWGRFTYSPYDWGRADLLGYAEFLVAHLEFVAFSGRSDPNYGSPWLFRVRRRPGPPASRLLFLPGAERAFTFASLAAVHGAWDDAVARFRAFGFLPPVDSISSMEGDALLAAGRVREAYLLLKRTVDDGLVDDTNLLDLGVAAAKLGRRAEAAAVLDRAAGVYPLWPERIAAARKAAGL